MDLMTRFCDCLPDYIPDTDKVCWEWQGGLDAYGYGVIKQKKAHRIAYEAYYSEPLNDLHCLHTCDNPKCVNPRHLYAGTNADNIRDKVSRGRCYTGYQKGESNGYSKFSDEDVKNIRKLYATGDYTTVKLGKMYNVHRATISLMVNNKTWQHILEGDS